MYSSAPQVSHIQGLPWTSRQRHAHLAAKAVQLLSVLQAGFFKQGRLEHQHIKQRRMPAAPFW
jgi:hypothetical protein